MKAPREEEAAVFFWFGGVAAVSRTPADLQKLNIFYLIRIINGRVVLEQREDGLHKKKSPSTTEIVEIV